MVVRVHERKETCRILGLGNEFDANFAKITAKYISK